MERQKDGLAYQKAVVAKYGLEEDPTYTGKWDAYYNGVPVEIKLVKEDNNIDFSSLKRKSEITEPFYLIIGYWRKCKDIYGNTHKIVVEEIILYIDDMELWQAQFPDECKHLLDKNYVFDGISNAYEDDIKWRVRRKQVVAEWNRHNTGILIRCKRDHKNQKRIQCALKKSFLRDVLIPRFSVDLG